MLNEKINFKRVIFLILISTTLLLIIYRFIVKKIKVENLKLVEKEFIYIKGNFKDTLEKELRKNKLKEEEIQKIIKAYSKLELDFRKLNEKDEYIICLSSTNSFNYMIIDRGEYIYSVNYSTDEYNYEKIENHIEITTHTVEGDIKKILWTSMIEKNVPPQIIMDFTDIFAWEIDFLTEVRDNDKFKVVWIEKRNKRNKLISRKILGGLYNGSQTGKKIMVYFKGDYYNEKGEGAKSMFLKAPLQYRRISSYFSYKRFHPVLRYVRPHLGIDYAASIGTPVSTVADGIVIYKGWKGGYGNYVEIKHNINYYTSYGHLSRFAKNLYVGKKVKQGEVIGYVGMSGIATGPHLDFRIRQGDKYINFLKIKRTSNTKLDERYIPEIERIIKDLKLI